MSDFAYTYFPYEDDDDDLCWHEEYDMDILAGRASCYQCGHVWFASEAEWQSYIRAYTP
ncbi:MAG TPA: hypothetical protein VGG45_16380 [Terracidiphilus sp.]|jgi:hypothetical protein